MKKRMEELVLDRLLNRVFEIIAAEKTKVQKTNSGILGGNKLIEFNQDSIEIMIEELCDINLCKVGILTDKETWVLRTKLGLENQKDRFELKDEKPLKEIGELIKGKVFSDSKNKPEKLKPEIAIIPIEHNAMKYFFRSVRKLTHKEYSDETRLSTLAYYRDISSKVANKFYHNNVETVGEVLNLEKEELKNIFKRKSKTLNGVIDSMNKLDFSFGFEDSFQKIKKY